MCGLNGSAFRRLVPDRKNSKLQITVMKHYGKAADRDLDLRQAGRQAGRQAHTHDLSLRRCRSCPLEVVPVKLIKQEICPSKGCRIQTDNQLTDVVQHT